LGCAKRNIAQSKFLHLELEPFARQLQHPSRVSHVSSHLLQRAMNQLSFQLTHCCAHLFFEAHLRLLNGLSRRTNLGNLMRQMLSENRIAVSEQHRTFKHIFKLTNVPWPMIG